MATLDPSRCPVCGDQNGCAAVAAGRERCTDCWCFRVTIPAEALARVPAAARDRACLCARCAGAIPGTPSAQDGSQGSGRVRD